MAQNVREVNGGRRLRANMEGCRPSGNNNGGQFSSVVTHILMIPELNKVILIK